VKLNLTNAVKMRWWEMRTWTVYINCTTTLVYCFCFSRWLPKLGVNGLLVTLQKREREGLTDGLTITLWSWALLRRPPVGQPLDDSSWYYPPAYILVFLVVSFPLAFPPITYTCSSSSPCVLMPHPYYSPWLDYYNYTWRTVQITKLLLTQKRTFLYIAICRPTPK
jgi:hypothetical protein